ncbi:MULTISPECIES: PilW family protein [Shewanella]|uniref:PilW family protein n=1 Tax=Shewanella TaxID=22 RepID=UPI000C643E06|nr:MULTISPECIES: PilW family protein [Shewanella]NCQ44595.1 prepilin-type N-terminal cleavage/methylation domain-containing protein [Shewanella frigidimarina]NCO72258.1 prepilin-type N-terminal cleavage/methylation domain-containing protein [Shewanella vesiculosa]NCP35938.1 prepilin-type N-terminal cleavage/methylation domain-containing protein [Shewanella vesiculosa]NCP68675.1 prepilin-type N-terminal cleavage/methylation domain-containing protein [Shewanella vesiculosa]NCP73602.1 prepilin-ty
MIILFDKQRGLSLVELMVAMLISLFLTAGLFTMFSMSSSNVTTTSQFNQLQENGRIALAILERDLSQLGFMGDFTGTPGNITVSSTAVTNDCVGAGLNNASFPNAQPTGFRYLWGYEQGVSPQSLACISPNSKTDVIQIKRLIGPPATFLTATRYYVASTLKAIVFFDGNAAAPGLVNSRNWEYQHHVYFIRDDGDIPVLRRRTLSINNGMNNEEQLVEGIENMRVLYGVDSNADGTADSYMPAENVTTLMWDNDNEIVSLKVFLLVRSSDKDRSYTNDTTYQLGDKKIGPLKDNYRRKIVSTTIVLENRILNN